MMKYTSPNMEIVEFEEEDVITTSSCGSEEIICVANSSCPTKTTDTML